MFGLRLENIPLINLRIEFNSNLTLLSQPDFRARFQGTVRPIQTDYLLWVGMPGDLLTLLLQRALLGIESYVVGAVYIEAGLGGKLRSGVGKTLKNPFSLGGRTTVENYYHRLPSIVSPECSLRSSNPGLWDMTRQFYTEVRNPFFHGKQLQPQNVEGVFNAYSFLADLYSWIDSWHSPENIIKGGSQLSNIKQRLASKSALNPAPGQEPRAG